MYIYIHILYSMKLIDIHIDVLSQWSHIIMINLQRDTHMLLGLAWFHTLRCLIAQLIPLDFVASWQVLSWPRVFSTSLESLLEPFHPQDCSWVVNWQFNGCIQLLSRKDSPSQVRTVKMRTPAETVGERDNTCADPAMKTLKEDEEALAAMKDAVASSWKQDGSFCISKEKIPRCGPSRPQRDSCWHTSTASPITHCTARDQTFVTQSYSRTVKWTLQAVWKAWTPWVSTRILSNFAWVPKWFWYPSQHKLFHISRYLTTHQWGHNQNFIPLTGSGLFALASGFNHSCESPTYHKPADFCEGSDPQPPHKLVGALLKRQALGAAIFHWDLTAFVTNQKVEAGEELKTQTP